MTPSKIIAVLEESGFKEITYEGRDCHAMYFDMYGGDAKFVCEKDDDTTHGDVWMKLKGSEDWHYWSNILPEEEQDEDEEDEF